MTAVTASTTAGVDHAAGKGSPLRPTAAAPAGTGVVEARRRGRLVLAEKVVAKVAAQAAAELGAVHGRTDGLPGIGRTPDSAARPKVEVELTADFADLAIAVGIGYPGSIRQTAQAIRDQVTARVEGLTGVPVHRVDVDVTFLAVPADPAGPARTVLR